MNIIKLKSLMPQNAIIEYKKYSTPSRGTSTTDFNTFKEDFLTNYSDAINQFKNKNLLYRTYSSFKGNFIKLNPEYSPRYAKDSNNIYTSLLEILPLWKNYPKRSFSVIFTTIKPDAYYGRHAYIVFPKNNAKLAVCREHDCWISFKFLMQSGLGQLDDLNGSLLYIFEKLYDVNVLKFKTITSPDLKQLLSQFNEKIESSSVNTFKSSLKNLYDRIVSKYFSYTKEYIKNIINYIDENKSFNWISYLDYLLDPVKNNVVLTDINNKSLYMSYREGWTESEVILIYESQINKVLINQASPDEGI